jgi:hypothetical protein
MYSAYKVNGSCSLDALCTLHTELETSLNSFLSERGCHWRVDVKARHFVLLSQVKKKTYRVLICKPERLTRS